MGAGTIDTLDIQIAASFSKANAELNNLTKKLEKVSAALSGVNSRGLATLGSGVNKLAKGMSKFDNNSRIDTFSKLVNGIKKLGEIDTQRLQGTISGINTLSTSLSGIGASSANIKSLSDLASGLSKLGGKNAEKAVTTIPLLATSLRDMMNTLSRAPQVSNNIIRMTNAMANLASQGSRVGTASTSVSNSLNRYSNSASRAEKSSRTLAYAFGKLYANYFLFIRGIKKLGKAITSSMDYIEEYNYFNVTMGKIGSEWSSQYAEYGYESAEVYAASFEERMNELTSKMTGYNVHTDGTLSATNSANLGLDVTQLMNYEASVNQVTNSLGLTGEASIATSKALSMLAGDMSSFRNTELSTVMTNFQSGLIGQSRALYKYGIDITNATLQTYAYELGIDKAISKMTQAEKMQLRTLAILDQSKVAWGDLANTIESPSNQLRMLKNNMSALSREIGNLFLPVVAKVLPYVNGLAIAVRRLVEWSSKMLGIDLSGIINNSGAGYTDAFDNITDDVNDYSDAVDDAASSAKELKNELMGFDEMNKLSDTSSDSSSSSDTGNAGTINLTDELTKALADYESVWNEAFENMDSSALRYADDITGFFKGIAKYAEPSVEAVKNLWNDGLSKFRDFSSGAAQDFLDDFLIPLGEWTLGTGFPKLVKCFNDFLNRIKWDKLRANLDDFWEGIEPFVEGFGDGFIDFFSGMSKIGAPIINALGDTIGGFGRSLKLIGIDNVFALGQGFGKLAAAIISMKGLNLIVSTVIGAISAHPYVALAGSIGLFVGAFYNLVHGIEIGDKSDSWTDLPDKISNLVDASGKLKESYENLAETNMNNISEVIAEYDGIREMAAEYLEMSGNYNNLTEEQKELVNAYAQTLSDKVGGIEGNINDITGAWEGTTDELQKAIDKQEEYALNTAKTNIVSDLYKTLAESKKGYDDAFAEFKKSVEDMYGYTDDVSDINAKKAVKYLSEVGFNAKKLSTEKLSLVHTVRTENEAFDAYLDRIEATSKSMGDYSETLGNVQDDISYYNNLTLDAIKNNENWEKESTENSESMKNKLDEDMTSIANSVTEAHDKIMESSKNTEDEIKTTHSGVKRSFSDTMNGMVNDSDSAVKKSNALLDTLKIAPLRINTTPFTTGASLAVSSTNNLLNGGITRPSLDLRTGSFTQNAYDAVINVNGILAQVRTTVLEMDTGDAMYAINKFVTGVKDKLGSVKFNMDLLKGNTSSSQTLLGLGLSPMPGYATGGYPDMSNPFVVGEKGPEIMGGMYGQPTVANSNSITDGIRQAAYDGMKQALSESSGSQNVTFQIEGDPKGMFKIVKKEADKYTLMTGKAAFLQ